MFWWLGACVAWLSGVAWQLGEPVLWAWGWYGGGLGLAALLLGGRWLGSRYGARRVARSGAALAEVGGRLLWLPALALAAWSAAGLHAWSRASQQLPASWAGTDVMVEAQVESLPQATPGGVLFDARVVNWPDAGVLSGKVPNGAPEPGAVDGSVEGTMDGDVARQPAQPAPAKASCCLPRWLQPRLPDHLSLRMNLADGATLPQAGQRWRLMVRLHEPDGLANPAGFDATLPAFERDVRAMGQVRDRRVPPLKLGDEPERAWQGALDRQRQRIRTAIFAHVADKRAAGVLAGLSVGDQSAIERDDWQVFRRTGVAHLVSISGAHIAMFGWLAAALVRRLWARSALLVHAVPAAEVARWAAVLASTLYALLAGWGVPAQRTVWMMLVMTLLRSGGRRWPWPLVWLASAVVVTALDPWALRQAGFWLSYVAVGVLMTSGARELAMPTQAGDEPAEPSASSNLPGRVWTPAWLAMKEAVVDMVRTQWLVTVALTPLAAVCFQQVSLVSVLANLGAIPLFTLGITPLALLGSIWAPAWGAGQWLIEWAMQLLEAMSGLPWAVASAPALPWWVALPVVIAGFAQALQASWRWRLLALPFALPLLYLPASWQLLPPPHKGHFQLLAVDIGQGTAVLLRTAHHTLLFDTGPRIGTQSNAGDRILLPLLRAMAVQRLDALLISHQDTDHVGGAAALINELPVASLISSLDDAHPLRHQPSTSGVPLPHQACVAGQRWRWDEVDFVVLHPTADDYARRADLSPNALSCVLRVSRAADPAVSALLTGDIEAAQEAELLARQAALQGGAAASGRPDPASTLRSTVLLAAHHGSKTSSTPAWLQAVQPDQVVIQAGRRNAYKHPSQAVLARYDAMGLAWQATPDCGAYVWHSDEVAKPALHQQPGELLRQQPQVGHCWRSSHRHYWDSAGTQAAHRRPPPPIPHQ